MSKNILVSFYGPAGAGKDYVASEFRKLFVEKNKLSDPWFSMWSAGNLSFASPLKENLSRMFNIDPNDLEDSYLKEHSYLDMATAKKCVIDDQTEYIKQGYSFHDAAWFKANKAMKWHKCFISYRELMVYYGTYVCKEMLSDNVWVNAFFYADVYKRYIVKQDDFNKLLTVSDMRFTNEYQRLKEAGAVIVKINGFSKGIDNIAEKFYSLFEPDFTFENTKDKAEFDKRLEDLYSKIMAFDSLAGQTKIS